MAISYSSTGPVTYDSSNTLTAITPATVTAGQLLVLLVHMKPSVVGGGTLATPYGWILVGSATGRGGYTTVAADAANSSIYVFTHVAGALDSNRIFNLTATQNDVSATQVFSFTSSTTFGDYAAAVGEQAVAPATAAMSVASGALAVASGDMLLWAFGMATDLTIPAAFSAEGLAATGSTMGASTEIGEWGTTLGTDIGGVVGYTTVTAGSSSGAVTWTATVAGALTNRRGPLIILRIREGVATDGVNAQTMQASVLSVESPLQRVNMLDVSVLSAYAPMNDLWVWNGTTAVPASVTVWNGSTEVAAGVSVV